MSYLGGNSMQIQENTGTLVEGCTFNRNVGMQGQRDGGALKADTRDGGSGSGIVTVKMMSEKTIFRVEVGKLVIRDNYFFENLSGGGASAVQIKGYSNVIIEDCLF